jgi:hypothetical protein
LNPVSTPWGWNESDPTPLKPPSGFNVVWHMPALL